MDLQFQQLFQKKPNRPPPQSNPIQQPNRPPPNIHRSAPFVPQVSRQQNNQYRGNQQNQYQDQNRGQGGRGQFRQQRQQTGQQQYHGGNRNNYNQGGNRNQPNQYQNQYQDTNYNQSPQNYRQPRQNNQSRQQFNNPPPKQFNPPQKRYQQKQYQGKGQQNQRQPRQNQAYQKPYNNRNQQRQDSVPQQRNQRNNQNSYDNMSSQDAMKQAMSAYFENEFHNQPRGRGRGRGNRGRGNYQRGQNQHQRPYESSMDKQQNKQRLQKFKPKPAFPPPKKQSQNKKFIKKDQEISQNSLQPQSEQQYSQDGSGSQQRSQSGSYSQYSDQGSRSQEGQDQRNNQSQQENKSIQQDDQSQQQNEQQQADHVTPFKLPSIKSMNDISTNAINDMCSKQQFNQRLQTFQQNNRDAQHSKLRLDTSRSFSIFQINKRNLKPDYSLALKRFKRSAQRAEGQDQQDNKDCRRSVKALVKVMNHINKQIIDADNMKTKDLAFPLPPGQQSFEFIHVYDFLWDRMRQMIKDITCLSIKQKLTKQIITICQQIARFFILSINQGRKKYNSKLKFNQRMNIQSITKVISNLMEVYPQSRMNLKSLIQSLPDSEKQNLTIEKVQALMLLHGIYLSPYQPQLSAYSFLFSDNRKKQFYQILTVGFEDQDSQSDNPLINSEQMKRALDVHRILNQRNIEKYFHKIQQSSTDYVFACIMLKHLQMVRKQTSKILFKTHYFKGQKDQTAQKFAILAQTLRQTLRFPQFQTQQFIDFLDMLGVKKQGKLLIWRQNAMNDDHYIVPEYIFENDKTERKNWSDTQCKKVTFHPNKLSREQMIKCSWKKSTYRQQIINFFLGKKLQAKPIKQKIRMSRQIPIKQTSKQSIQISKQKQAQDLALQKQKQTKNLLTLNEMRKGLQKKQKRTKFLQKVQTQILELFRHTDQAKIINRKKALAILDEWIMYYHDKMIRLSFNMLENESKKKNLLANMLREIKTNAGIKKNFYERFNKSPYEFQAINEKNTVLQRTQKGLMSILLAKAHFKAKKISYECFQQYLNTSQHSFANKHLNFMILTTCSSSSQNQKILFDTILYFMHQQRGNSIFKKKQINDAIIRNRTKQKQVPLLKVYFESQNITLNLRLAKINESKSKRKAMTQNSHVIQHLFGCHGLILMRDNSKHHATQVILQNLQDFVNNRSRIYQGDEQQDGKQNIKTLQSIELPILLINAIKKPSGLDQNKPVNLSKISKQKYSYLINLNQAIVIEGSTDPYNLPFMLRQQIKKQLKNTQQYIITMNAINAYTHRYELNNEIDLNKIMNQSNNASFELKPLRQLLRQIRVNSSFIQQKLGLKQSDISSQIKKRYIFSFYQEYFNICLNQISQQASSCYKNSIYFKKWTKNLLIVQNILSQKDFIKTDLQQGKQIKLSQTQQQQLISNTLESQPQYNIISETFKQYQFIMGICQDLKMKFVGQHIQPIQTKYLIFDQQGFNVFGMPRKSNKNQTPRQEKQKILHLTHFINTIGKYISLFDSNKTLSDDKFQSLYSTFQEYGLQFKLFNLSNLIYGTNDQNEKKQLKINYQIQGDSLQYFSYLIGYLMDGCKLVNVLLPKNFRFKVNMQDFVHKSMKNLNSVINVLNYKKKDIFQNLKYQKISSLQRLVIDEPSYQNTLQNYRTRDKYNNLNNINSRQNIYDVDEQYSGIDVDEQEQIEVQKGSTRYKREIDYHYKSVYPSISIQMDPRRQLLNQLKKRVKT